MNPDTHQDENEGWNISKAVFLKINSSKKKGKFLHNSALASKMGLNFKNAHYILYLLGDA